MSATDRIVIGLSGGVDSAVAALLLKEQGYDVQGLFMSNWEAQDDSYCTSANDYQDARAVARELGIPLHRVSFAAEYRAQVFEYFLLEQRAGRTPNPDVLCNREIKFGVALRHAQRLGGKRLATGHYAQLTQGRGTTQLRKAVDGSKDQSYFLHAVGQRELASALMPLGALHKSEVRERARSAGLPVFDKPDSTGICFIGERPFREFLAQFIAPLPGPIQTPDGTRVGTHSGLAFYTLGQREGLCIGGQRGGAEQPWYVAVKDRERNALIVVQGHDHPLLASDTLDSGSMHWLVEARQEPFRCTAKVRYRQLDQQARVEPLPDGTVRVIFDQPQRAVTPGQYVVLYEDDLCLGGATIETVASAALQPYNSRRFFTAEAL